MPGIDDRPAKVWTLVALDWNGEGLAVDSVVEFVKREGGDKALVGVEETTIPHWRSGEPVAAFLVAFDARRVRDTGVSGAAFRAGFVSHVEARWRQAAG